VGATVENIEAQIGPLEKMAQAETCAFFARSRASFE